MRWSDPNFFALYSCLPNLKSAISLHGKGAHMKIHQIIFGIVVLLSEIAFADPVIHEFDAKGLSSLVVENPSGTIQISAMDGSKAKVSATKVKFGEKCSMIIEKDGNSVLTVKVKNKSLLGGEDCQVNFDVRVPKAINLDVKNGSGAVAIHGISGALDFKNGSGDLSADGTFNKLNAMTGSGSLTIKGLVSGGELKSGSGNLSLSFKDKKLSGELNLVTGSGSVTLQFLKGTQIRTQATIGSGELKNQLGETPNAPFSVNAVVGSGNLEIKAN